MGTDRSNTGGRGRLYVIAAPSGAGKTSLVRALMQSDPGLRFSVSYTTRARRPNEVDGRDYHFVSVERFRAMVGRGEFLEHAQVFDNYYGTGLETVREALGRGERLLLEIDWQGARQVRARLPEACTIFVLPPSLAALEQRLRGRGTDTDEVIRRRLRDAVADIGHCVEFEYVVVNDRFDQALADLRAIVSGGGEDLTAGRAPIRDLLAALSVDGTGGRGA